MADAHCAAQFPWLRAPLLHWSQVDILLSLVPLWVRLRASERASGKRPPACQLSPQCDGALSAQLKWRQELAGRLCGSWEEFGIVLAASLLVHRCLQASAESRLRVSQWRRQWRLPYAKMSDRSVQFLANESGPPSKSRRAQVNRCLNDGRFLGARPVVGPEEGARKFIKSFSVIAAPHSPVL